MKKAAIIIILIVIVCGFAFGLFKLNKALESSKSKQPKSTTTQQQSTIQNNTITLANISNAQILNVANGSMQNTEYTFKSVLSKSLSNNQLNLVLLGFMEQNGKYMTQRIDLSLQDINGSIQVVPGSFQGTNITTQATVQYQGSTSIANKENAITRVLQYLNGQGYNVNASSWAIDAFPDQAIDNYNGYLVHVYETFDGNPTSVGWFLVGNSGQLYTAGSNGSGPIVSV